MTDAMTDAIEAGARASDTIWDELCRRCAAHDDISLVKRLVMVGKDDLEAAIASGALVPASAVAEMRERCAQLCENPSKPPGRGHACIATGKRLASFIRQLDIAPASGDYVVVPKTPTDAMIRAGDAAGGGAGMRFCTPVTDDIWNAMLNAASRTGSEK